MEVTQSEIHPEKPATNKDDKKPLRHNSGPQRWATWYSFLISKKIIFPEILLSIFKRL